MKIATIINPSLSKQTNVILENTSFSKDIKIVCDKSFKPTNVFFDFVEDLIGKNKLGDISDCYVAIIDTDQVNDYIDPMNKLLGILQIVNKDNNYE